MQLNDLKNINWKRHSNTVIKILLDVKVLGLIALFAFTAYGIGWDTVFRPSLENMKSRDEAIVQQRKALEQKGSQNKQYADLEQQLRGLDTTLVSIPTGNASTVIAVSEAAELLELAKGEKRDEDSLPPLPPPHDKRDNVSLTATSNAAIDLLQLSGQAPVSNTPAPSSDSQAKQPNATGASTATPQSMPAEQFNYELKASGTYPALIDLLNQLILRKKLVKINKVQISHNPALSAEEPDSKDYPDYPVKLDMVISLSIFLYAAPASS